MKLALAVITVWTMACSSSSPAKQDAPAAQHDAAKDGAGSGSGTFALTLHNYLAWCEATVNGGAATTADQTVNVAPGTITLTAKGATGFMLGSNMWHHTSGDTGNGEPGTVNAMTSTATVVVTNAAKCAWVCCPSTTDTTDCDGLPDQCP